MVDEFKWHFQWAYIYVIDYNPHIVQDNLLFILYDSIILDLQSMHEDVYNYVFLRSSLGTYFQYANAMAYFVEYVSM